MKKKHIGLYSVIAVVIILVIFIVGSYNGLVEKKESVDNSQATISTQLQRRADLIPNFVATVKGYSDYEQKTYTAVTEARSKVSKASSVSDQQKASAELDGAISVWVNAITEAYPDLKASAQYTALQDELSGTENRISQARKDYNASAKTYNVSIKTFPRNILANIFGFDKADYFEAQAGTENVPKVDFN